MNHKHLFLIVLAFAFLAGCQTQNQALVNQNMPVNSDNQNNQPAPVETSTVSLVNNSVNTNQAVTSTVPVNKPTSTPSQTTTAKFLDYPVAFATQAPYSNWDALHEEACEEASMTMAEKYVKNEPLTAHIMEQSILNVIKWEGENGYKVDLSAQEAVDILAKYFNVKSQLDNTVTTAEIKKQLQAGNIIIIPAAGRHLGNPNFKAPGPLYHMLVVRGYDDNRGEFITNDPGTRKGEGYRYKYQVLIDAIHNWDHLWDQNGATVTDSQMVQGKKVMIIINK
ncbi:MAG: C39 family peptidase [Patescibacteria group bacterium]